MNKHDYAGQTAVAGAKLLRAAKVATDATTPSQARTALREIASILDGMPGQDEMVSQLRSGAGILDDRQALDLCQQMASMFPMQARMLGETAEKLMDIDEKPAARPQPSTKRNDKPLQKKWWQFWR